MMNLYTQHELAKAIHTPPVVIWGMIFDGIGLMALIGMVFMWGAIS